MAYFSSSKSVPGELQTIRFASGKLVSVTDGPAPSGILIDESRTGTVTPGWYTKSKQRFVSYTRRNGTVKYFYKSTRKRLTESEYLSQSMSDPNTQVARNPYRLAIQENPFTYSYVRQRKSHGWGSYGSASNNKTIWVGDLSGTNFNASASPWVWPQATIDALENQCVNKMLLKIKDQKLNALQAIAEMEQTASLMGGTALKLLGMYRSLKRGDLLGAASSLGVHASKRAATRYRQTFSPGNLTKSIGDGVLQLQYGWDPLLQDCYGAAEAIAQANIREIRNTARARSKRTFHNTSQVKSQNANGEIVDTTRVTAFLEVSMRCHFAMSSPALHSLSQLGFSNPALIAWELTPWSFVIDWFIPFGNYLSSLDATLGLSFVSGSKTHFSRTFSERDTAYSGRSGISPAATYLGQSASDAFSIKCVRTKLSAFPSSRPPAFKNPLSFQHCINAIALLTGFKKSVR